MAIDQIDIRGLGGRGHRLKGMAVTVFTVDGNAISGVVQEADDIVIYVAESEDRTRMIKTSAIASVSVSTTDAKQIMAPEETSICTPIVGH